MTCVPCRNSNENPQKSQRYGTGRDDNHDHGPYQMILKGKSRERLPDQLLPLTLIPLREKKSAEVMTVTVPEVQRSVYYLLPSSLL